MWRSYPRPWAMLLALLLGAASAGCQDGNPTEVVVELSSNEEGEIASLLNKIQMWFDAEGGFKGVGPSTSVPGFDLRDLDDDGLPELMVEMKVKPPHLPKLRLDPGSNQNTSISIQAMGLDAEGKLVAIGGTSPQVLFIPSMRKTVQVDFVRIGPNTNPGSFPQILLEPQPLFNSPAQVLAVINAIEVVLDLPGGIDDQDAFISRFNRRDVDGDGESELVQEIPWSGQSAMPEVAVDVSIAPSKRVRVNVRGMTAQGQVAAYGGASFIYGTRQEIKVPFNLSRSFLPPRVVGFAPLTFPKALYPSSLGFYTSKKLSPESVAHNTHFLVHLSSGTSTELSVNLEYRDCPFGTQMWKATPKACYESPSLLITLTGIELVIDPGATDTSGAPLTPASAIRYKLPLSSTWHVGPCNPSKPCEGVVGEFHPADALCSPSTHLFEPAPCNLTATAPNCQHDRDVLDWAHPESQAQCLQWNSDTTFNPGSCQFTKAPLPCSTNCASIGQSCQGSCPDDAQVCDSGQGCLPRLMGCAENCIIYGGCPDLRQICTQVSEKVYACR